MSEHKPRTKDELSFLKQQRETPEKRPSSDRKNDFNEIYRTKSEEGLQEQADRCLDCGNPYCEWKCPLHNYIPNWLELVNNGQYDQAAVLMHETNPLPEICGRVCPQDRLCEQACTINTGFGAVTIGAIEKNISDRALDKNWRPDLSNVKPTDKSVAIIGAGPAGLGCAELLARNGVKPIVYDRYPEIGGLLTFGIPSFKLEKKIVRKRRQYLEDIGVEFHLNTEVGKDINIEELQSKHDNVFLAMGTYKPHDGSLPGLSTQGVIKALDYLVGNVNQQEDFGMTDYPLEEMKDKKVLVLGGGDTAMDCVRSAVRQQSKLVQCVYRRGEDDMPGSKQEVKNAKEEGVDFLYHLQPISIESNDGKLTGVKFIRAATAEKPEEEIIIETDRVIIAFGFGASPAPWFESIGITLNNNGLVKTQPSNNYNLAYSQQTQVDGIYAGGDMVKGADLVVTAIAEGRQAAKEILSSMGIATI